MQLQNYNFKTFTTCSRDITPKPGSTANVSELPTFSKEETSEKFLSTGCCLLR